MSFAHDIAGGSGNLIIAQVQSPNFSITNQTGWALLKNGTFYAWDLVYSAEFVGTNFIINNQGMFFYSGVPAAGNLIASSCQGSGTDQFGNLFVDGFTVYEDVTANPARMQLHVNQSIGAPAIEMPTGLSSEAEHASLYTEVVNGGAVNELMATWLAGPGSTHDNKQADVLLFSSAKDGSATATGQLLYFTPAQTVIAYWNATGFHVIPSDGNTYPTGHLVVNATATPQTINLTSAQTVTGCTTNTGAISYRLKAVAQFTANAAAGNPSFQIGVSGTTSTMWGNAVIWQTSGTGAGANRFVADTSGLVFQGPGMVSGAVYTVQIDGYVTYTTTGAISLQAFTSSASDTFTINNAFLELLPIY